MKWVSGGGSGGSGGTAEDAAAQATLEEKHWPYVWAIRESEVLDWKRGLEPEQLQPLAIVQQDMPVEIMSHLYLSDARRARDITTLKAKGITHVLNVAGLEAPSPVKEYEKEGITLLSINADDEEGYRMVENNLVECRAFVDGVKAAGGKCVCHCVAGINRSGVTVAALLLLERSEMTVLEAVAHCRRRRGNAFLWNHTFQRELVALADREGRLGPLPGEEGCCAAEACPTKSESEAAAALFDRSGAAPKKAFKAADVKTLFG